MLDLKTKFKILFIGLVMLFSPLIIRADHLGQQNIFFIESSYDLEEREQISASLQKVTDQLYFYFDDGWWKSLNYQEKQETGQVLDSLANEFNNQIYPALTSTFGSEWKPGIDKDEKITVLFHPMLEETGGYFRTGDEYLRLQVPRSNEREMLYLNVDYIDSPLAKSFLAHEFVHLITFNQKEKIRGVTEDIWLNEARAEYAPTLLGYDSDSRGSNLEKKKNIFLENLSDPLTEWKGEKSDYGALNLFVQYLVDHYGIDILSASLHSESVGISSLNEALKKNGFSENFSQIFTDWTLTVVVNDCSLGEKYCYLNTILNDFRINPIANFLPLTGESTLSVSTATKDWAGNWYRFVGGKGFLKLEFTGSSWVDFTVPYLIKDIVGNYSIGFMDLDENQRGEISVSDFGDENIFLIIIPSIQNKISDFSSEEPSYSFYWSASVTKNKEEQKKEPEENQEDSELIQNLLAQIESLNDEIARLRAEIDKILGHQPSQFSKAIPNGFTFIQNLSQGIKSNDVVYLKNILDREVDHAPWSGTNYFGTKTLEAVKKFQEKYKTEISDFVGYEIACTGFVGKGTKTKLNEIIKESFS